MKKFQSKYKGFCGTCHYTIWKNEYVTMNNVVTHVNCIKSLTDPTPRVIDPQYKIVHGEIDKQKLISQLKQPKNTKGLRNYTIKSSKGGVRFIS